MFTFLKENQYQVTFLCEKNESTILHNSETQRLVQNVILKLEKIKMVFVKPVMVNVRRKFVKHVTVMSATHT